MDILEKLLQKNKNWAKSAIKEQSDFFTRHSKSQNPQVLWLGCSDSRVSETKILDASLGEVFSHRNIANQVSANDLSAMSVVFSAINVFNIRHVIICGHYGCSGVNAALAGNQQGIFGEWIKPIIDLKEENIEKLTPLTDDEKSKLLVELNVAKQVENLSQTQDVKNVWQQGSSLAIYGMVYDLETGLLKEITRKSIDS